MKKILLVNYYGMKDSIKCAGESLEKLGYIIDSYPLFRYAYDINDKKENYKDHFNQYIQETLPDIIFWWFIYVHVDIIRFISVNNPKCYSILFCWDDPFIWIDKNTNISEKCPYFDLAVTACEESIDEYKKYGTKDVVFCPPGYDTKINYPMDETNDKYQCDISICCTNLYEDSNIYSDQYINRRELIDIIVEGSTSGGEEDKGNISDIGYTFHIYGPEFMKYRYPDNYKGFIEYNKLNEIHNKSKINICTHVCSSKSNYINERSILVLGSGGLLMVDPVKNINTIINDNECIFIQKDRVVDQIKEILSDISNNIGKYKTIKHNGHKRSMEYTWDKWAEKIHKKIGMYFFNDTTYRTLYNIPENIVNLKDYWEKEGIFYNHIPFVFDVPKNFDYPQYSMDNSTNENNTITSEVSEAKLSTKSKEYLYWHYRIYSRLPRYILQFDSKKNFDIKDILNKCKIDSSGWFKINNIFKSITKADNTDRNLLLLETLNRQYPYSDVNSLLSLYFDINDK